MSGEAPIRLARQLIHEEVSRQIRQLIAEQELWDGYLAPERELAELFGVSRESIRRSLRDLEREGLVARQRGQGTLVLPRRREPGERAQARLLIASYGDAGASGDWPRGMLAGLSAASGRANWSLSFSNLQLPAARQDYFAALRAGTIDALLLFGIADRKLAEESLRAWNGPAVLLDHHFEGLPITGVIDDSEGGARQAVEHLIALGHSRIGYVEISVRARNPWRYAGYAGALRDAGIALDERLIRPSSNSFDAGLDAGRQLLEIDDPPTAILVFDDMRAFGVWRAIEARGLVVGRDVALIGYGDTAAQAGFSDELSSVRVDAQAMGRAAVEHLFEQLAGRARPGGVITIPAELQLRASSGAARARAGEGAS